MLIQHEINSLPPERLYLGKGLSQTANIDIRNQHMEAGGDCT